MKKAIGFYLTLVAAVLGIAGAIFASYSSSLSTENALTNSNLVLTAGIIGAVLACVGAGASSRKGNHNPVTATTVLAAIALYSYVYGQCILQRILLIAGLFSYNSGNTLGWNVFYACIGCAVCMIAGCILLIVSSFCKSVKAA